MVKRKCIAIAILGLAISPQVWAQNQCNYSVTQTQFTPMPAGLYGQNGNQAVTLTVSASDGSKESHRMTAGAGTNLPLKWYLYNTTSTTISYSVDGGTWTWWGAPSSSGSGNFTLLSSWAGHVVTLRIAGPDSDDTDKITVTNQAPGVYTSDNLPENFILQATVPYGGPDVYEACGICQQFPSGCQGVQHTPFGSAHAHNNATGVDRYFPYQQAGNTAGEYDNVNASMAIPGISHLTAFDAFAGDTISGDYSAEVDCSVMGTGIYNSNGPSWNAWSAWFSLTKVQVLPTTCRYVPGGGVRCLTTNFCTNGADWTPGFVQTNQFGLADMPPFWLGGTECFSVDGSPGVCPGSYIAGALPGPSNNFWRFVLAPGIPSDGSPFNCTHAKGTQGAQIPWPF